MSEGVEEVHVLWISEGMSCDGDSVSITAARLPALEEVVLGLIPGLPKVQLLLSPIVLGDYPQIAPESPGDLFDGDEVDELLVLNVLALTDVERDEMRASDARTREILDRCDALSPEALLRLHGARRL